MSDPLGYLVFMFDRRAALERGDEGAAECAEEQLLSLWPKLSPAARAILGRIGSLINQLERTNVDKV